MAKIAYIRVSTVEQHEDRQVVNIEEKYKVDKVFTDKCSGKDTNRPELKAMLDYMREGDTVYIHDFSRLARSTEDLLRLMRLFEEKKVTLISDKEKIDTSTPQGKLMLTMIGAINEFERANLLERQREGIAIAKAKGVYKGGKPKRIDKKLYEKLLEQYNTRQINKVEFSKKLGVSRPTLDKILKSADKC